MINEFKSGQTWKIWPSPLSLSLYSTFNDYLVSILENLKHWDEILIVIQ